ncbi:MAG: hypothetical protein VX955_04410, partial [Pseudomonadota bacterium]|nr:hypothetical protein [Pseudomonadota bacterium]
SPHSNELQGYGNQNHYGCTEHDNDYGEKNVMQELACRKVVLFRNVIGTFWPIVTIEPVHSDPNDKI